MTHPTGRPSPRSTLVNSDAAAPSEGATGPVAFLTLDGDETKRIQLASGDSYELTGPVNACSRHSVPPEPNCGL